MRRRICLWLWAAILLLIGACQPESQTVSESRPATRTPHASAEPSAVKRDDVATALPGAAAISPTPAATICETPVVRYVLAAELDWTAHTVQVKQQVHFCNAWDQAQDTLVFNIENNRKPGDFTLNQIATGNGRIIRDYTLDGARLMVPLPDPLPPNEAMDLILNFTLAIPPIQNGYHEGHLGYWGYSARQVNLGMWFPLVAPFDPYTGWITPVSHSLGEQSVLQVADFTVDLTLRNAPDEAHVAGPGVMSQPDKQTWRFELRGGRELALSVSAQYRTLTVETASGITVELFYFPTPLTDSLDTPRHALQTAADALTLFEELYGPYPHTRLVVVEGDFPDGMEFSGLVFVSRDWFDAWRGIPNDWLTVITTHEVAHQWWYALVGNDQANDPYLDEALSLYSEALFFERYYPDLVDWWWQFRVAMYAPTGYVDSTVYEFYSPRGYINAVYLRGALMMQALRADLGNEAFFTWLQQYTQKMGGHIASPADFWGTLPDDQYTATEDIRQAYLKRSGVFASPNKLP